MIPAKIRLTPSRARRATIACVTLVALLGAGLAAAQAQDAAPAPAATPPAADVVIDPAAAVGAVPKQQDLLTGFYATQAVIEICALPVEDSIKQGMAGDQKRLEASVGLDAAAAATAYAKVKADVEKTKPDCADGSVDRQSVDAITAIYAAGAAKSAAPAAAAAPAAEAAPATPAQ